MCKKTKHPIQKIHISHPRNLVKSHVFGSFRDADEYLKRIFSILSDDIIFHVRFVWQGGIEYEDNLLLSIYDVEGTRYLETFLQNTILHNLLIPTEAKTAQEMYDTVNQPSYQMERLIIPEAHIDKWQEILTDCEGFDDDAVLDTFELFRNAVRQSDDDHPSLLRVRERGRETIQRIRESSSTKIFQDHALAKIRKKYAALFEAAYSGNMDSFFYKDDLLITFEKTLWHEDTEPDERFSVFGEALYRLFPVDVFFFNANLDKLRSLDNDISNSYFARLEAMTDILPKFREDALNYAASYAKSYYEVFSLPAALRSHSNISRKAVQHMMKKGSTKNDILAEFRRTDPFVPFFLDGAYESMIFDDQSQEQEVLCARNE